MIGWTPSAIVLLGLVTRCAILTSILVAREIEEVNRKLSKAERISFVYMYPDKTRQIGAAYRRLYPTGRIDTFRLGPEMISFFSF